MDTEIADLPPLPNHTLSNTTACISTPDWAKQQQPNYHTKDSNFLSSFLSSSLETKTDQDDKEDQYFFITKIRDFGYPPVHPLHSSVFPTWHETAGSGSSRRSDASSGSSNNSTSAVVPTSSINSAAAAAEFPEITGRAIALFDFESENDNEIGLVAGQHIWVSYRHGQGWLVAQDPETGESGLVPEEYVQMVDPVLQRALIAGNRSYDEDNDDDEEEEGYEFDERALH